jgi:hypothetical protein
MPVNLATQEAENKPRQIVHETLSQKCISQKGLAGWLKVKALSLSSSTAKTNKQTKLNNELILMC